MVRCVETGRGSKGSVFVCDVKGVGDVVIKAVKVAPHKYRITVESPKRKFKASLTTMYARNRRSLRRYIEEYLRTTVENVLNVI